MISTAATITITISELLYPRGPCIMLSALVALFSTLLVGLLYRATSDSTTSLSPQGCRMSYMSPSYIIQSQFDTSWTQLAKRYSLLLYREVDWEDDEVSFVFVCLLLTVTNNQ